MSVIFFQFPLTLPVKHGTEDINVPICQPPMSRDLSSKARSKVVQYAGNQYFHSQDDLGLSRPSALCIFLATVLKRNSSCLSLTYTNETEIGGGTLFCHD